MLHINNKVSTIDATQVYEPLETLFSARTPLIIKGLVKDWALVKQASISDEAAMDYIRKFYSNSRKSPVVMYKSTPEKKGRFFYTEDVQGLDFEASRLSLDQVLDLLKEAKTQQDPPTYYVGSTTLDHCLPTFSEDNHLPLTHLNPLVSIWLGNRSKIAAHYDAPDNLACCASGKRKFTLFPIEQIDNLYIGPLERTPSGQAISMVDFDKPDFDKFPRFKEALEHAQVAELEPGDALFIPGMWWHHVESQSDFNVLINYWWRDSQKFMDTPANALHYAMLSIRDLPQQEKEAWKKIFEFYVFDEQNDGRYEHIPEAARGFLNPLNETSARQLRAWLLNKINK